MESIKNLYKFKIIEEPFDYLNLDLDTELINRYEYFDKQFQKLYAEKANIFKLVDCYFFIKNDPTWNAFAYKHKGYNIIGITHGYAIQMTEMFSEKYFQLMIENGLFKPEEKLQEAFEELNRLESLKFNDFMLQCSIHFTLGHEFEHILQLNSSEITEDLYLDENPNQSSFDMQRHTWEFDADRFGTFEVLRFIFSTYKKLNLKNDKILKLLLLYGLGSLFITRTLFYLRIVNSNKIANLQEFYTKKYSHPHSLVRILSILEYYHDDVKTTFPNLNIEIQELLNTSLWIVNIYLTSLFPNQTLISEIFRELDLHLESINSYNQELYDNAIRDNSIKKLLIARGIKFEYFTK